MLSKSASMSASKRHTSCQEPLSRSKAAKLLREGWRCSACTSVKKIHHLVAGEGAERVPTECWEGAKGSMVQGKVVQIRINIRRI